MKLIKIKTGYRFLLVFMLALSASGDEIRLKSGGLINGIITSNTNGIVTIDVGFGTTTVDTAAILSITRSTSEQNSALRTRFANENTIAAPALKPLLEKMYGLHSLRFRAINRQRELERLDGDIDSLEHSITDNAQGYEALTEDLRTLSNKEITEQYRVVGKAHQYNASIISLQQTIEHKKNDQRKGNPVLLTYMDSLAAMDETLYNFKKTCAPKLLNENVQALNSIENDLQQCKAEFRTVVADATFIRGDHIVVPVIINGHGPVYLILDTGASTVTLSRQLATKLGINFSDGSKVTATLADGQTTTGYSILLRSVSVGDFSAAKVRGLVLDKPPAPGIDGLLGMSYLQRFILRIDPANKKVVLKRIMAR